MRHRLVTAALGATMLAPGAAALADPYFSPGLTFVGTGGEGPMSGFSAGAELTYDEVDPHRFYDEVHYGALLQIEFDFAKRVRLNVGGQIFTGSVPIGGELAWSMIFGGPSVDHAAMISPFLGVGFVNLAVRGYIDTEGVTMAGAVSLKAPLQLAEDVLDASVVEGRPLRDAAGTIRKPAVAVIGRRRPPRAVAAMPVESRLPLGRAWLEAARDERAAVDAFRRLARQLARHGAPLSLIARARRSARDEVRHARGCLNIAEALLGLRLALVSPPIDDGPLPDLATLARESRLDGRVGEGAAAALAALGARRATVGPVARLQAAIAREEAAHAALAEGIERWAVAEGGAPARAALDRARPADADAVDIGDAAPAGDEALWRDWGRSTAAERRDAWHRAA